MCDNVNPFAALFSPVDEATLSPQISDNDKNVSDEEKDEPMDSIEEKISESFSTDVQCSEKSEKLDPSHELLRDAFGITLNQQPSADYKKFLVFIDTDSVEHAVFERLMLSNPEEKTVPSIGTKGWTFDNHTLMCKVIPYLFESFCKLQQYRKMEKFKDAAEELCKIIVRNVCTALQAPDLFEGQEIHAQFVSLFVYGLPITEELSSFTSGTVKVFASENGEIDDDMITTAFGPILDIIYKETLDRNILTFHQYWFEMLTTFASIEPLAKLIIRHSTPNTTNRTSSSIGRAYADTLLGALLSISCLPKTPDAPFDFFDKPLQQQRRSMVEGNIWTALERLCQCLHLVFHALLKCSLEVRHLTLQWIGNCLAANFRRGSIWSSQNEMIGGILSVSDGFMLNLSTVLLRLCIPFCADLDNPKVLKIDPTYCAIEAKDENESRNKGLHIKGLSSETCLIPTPEGETRPAAESFGFITEIFFFTHRALDLGYRVVLEKFLRTNQHLARIQRLHSDTQNNDPRASVLEAIFQRMSTEMTKYLSLRASLLVPEMMDLLAKFHAKTAFWLIQVNLDLSNEDSVQSSYAPKKVIPVTFPLPERVPTTLRCIPEFVVENTVGFICFLKRLSPNFFEEQGSSFLNHILTELVALMESPHRLYNPHLRARLAEGLEALLPTSDDNLNQGQPSMGTMYREMLFNEHPHRHQIVANLLEVFVSIEMTGQSVQFEQKFNYRRPMYIVMDYLWKLDEHRKNFKNLAEDAEKNMEAVQPPLFLRFINLLMNDAVFLLDEALSNMAQLKTMHQARESGEWDKLSPQERSQQANNLEHVGMIARFDNILGRETINMLKMLTTEIKSIFCHSTMVDRIASMLNYLLLQLVGPNNRNLKVKDQKEYDFNPANLVLNICEIYINLSLNENFTLAVSQDGRSYSPELFNLAENVLVRIGGVGILGDLNTFAKRVEEAAHMKKEEDEILNNAPDDFLDPIMSTLMTDPVVLPSSKITVDRQTIARHLLSDQTDPFNRSPLTMDMVKSNTELRSQIEEWIKQKKQEKSSTSEQS